MADVTRRIGLSLGADLCWPVCYEQLMRQLDPKIPWDGDTINLEVERVWIEPYNLRKPVRWVLVIDRLTHWYHTSREWIKKAVLMDGLYVLNNPWSLQSMEKHTTYCAMMHLGMPIPDTWMIPPKSYEPSPDLRPTLRRYAKLFDLGRLGELVGYPTVMKPYDGGGWRGISRVNNEGELRRAYEASGNYVMHVQKAVDPYDCFVRCVGIGPQLNIVKYDPTLPLHDRYTMERDFISEEDMSLLRDTTMTINAFFGWEFNSCEAMHSTADNIWYPIDFANACPDSQVTSLHYHFPWLVVSMLKWTIFCAVTGRKMRRTMDWDPFYEIAAEPDMPYRERIRAYAKIAEARMEQDRFHEFCDTHLAHLDEVAWNYFGSDPAKEAVRAKVAALYPEHEVEQFCELFWGRIQKWRQEQESKS